LVRCRVNSVNQINGIGEVLGFPPPSWNYNGTHKWNIFFSNHGLYYFEPQDGDFRPVTEGEYIPLRIDF